MPQVRDYLEALKQGARSVKTADRYLRQAFDAAQEGMHGPIYDELDRLAQEGERRKFKDTLTDRLRAPVQPAIAALPEEPTVAAEIIFRGMYGASEVDFYGFVDQGRERVDFGLFQRWLAEGRGFQEARALREGAAMAILDKVTIADVARYCGGAVAPYTARSLSATTTEQAPTFIIEQPDRVTLVDKRDLIACKEEHGIVTPRFLEGKEYMAKKK